jgi:hypothetical protein
MWYEVMPAWRHIISVALSFTQIKQFYFIICGNDGYMEGEHTNFTNSYPLWHSKRWIFCNSSPKKMPYTIGMPDKGSNPENPSSITMRAYGIQMLALRYQFVDTNLEENDVFFDEAGHAFVLKPEKLRYIPETIPAPPAQDPAVSFATRTVSSDFYKFEI